MLTWLCVLLWKINFENLACYKFNIEYLINCNIIVIFSVNYDIFIIVQTIPKHFENVVNCMLNDGIGEGLLMDNKELIDKVIENVSKVILGKKTQIYQIIKGIIADGHILIEDVPGVGKTTLVKALAKTLNLDFKRIQFTPDLLPSDITGISVYKKAKEDFEFIKGPVFSNLVLADEVNRTSPKTQAALLEVMEEYQVSEGNVTHKLDKPFIVLATENPIEYEGTFLLPEAQLDRFIMKVSLGYPDRKTESDILQVYQNQDPLDSIQAVGTKQDILYLQEEVKKIKASVPLTDYVTAIVRATRENKYISLGASTRAAIDLLRVSAAAALINERKYVIPEDVRENIMPVLSHRIKLSPLAKVNNLKIEDILSEIIDNTSIPRNYVYD